MSLQLSVDYYNSEEAQLFQSYEKYDQINQLISQGFTIPEDEFKSYLLFTEQADDDGWRTYNDFKAKVESRKSFIDDYLDFSDGSIKARFNPERMTASRMAESVGVSLGINVINQIHGLSEADWAITPNVYIKGKRVKDFDYEIPIASDGSRFIQIENKGCTVVDNNLKSSSVSQKYSSIKGKKESLRSRCISQNIYYGTIGVLDNHNTAKVWLVDPDAYNIDWNPSKYKLVSRLIYYLNVFKEIGIHKNISIALESRIDQLLGAKDYTSFNNIVLNLKKGVPSNLIQAKNIVAINYSDAFGTFFFLKSNQGIQVFMIALPKALINLVLSQNFDGILNYEYQNEEINDNVTIGLETKLNRASDEFENLGFILDDKRKRYFLQSYQHISHTSSGRIFGTVKM